MDVLRNQIIWLMDIPAGLKLNHKLAERVGVSIALVTEIKISFLFSFLTTFSYIASMSLYVFIYFGVCVIYISTLFVCVSVNYDH